MKICLLGNNGSVHIQKWVYAISMQPDVELHVITFNEGKKFDNVHYHYLKRFLNNKLDYILNGPLVRRLRKVIAPDLVHAHYATSYGLLGTLTGFHPYIITGWGADIFDSPKNKIINKVIRRSFKSADAITVLSKITLKEIRKLTSKKVELVPFGVDLSKFKVAERSSKNNTVHIGTIRTLSEKYGVEYLLRGFALVSKKYPDIFLHIVGDGPLRVLLAELAEQLGIAEKVQFYGYVNQNAEFERYIKILSGLDIFAILSVIDSETFGVAAVEASACGIPVIASNVGGLPEVVEDNQTGIIVPPRDSEAVATALETLIADKELRKSMGTNGRLKVESEYDWAENVNRMMEIYKRVVAQRKR